MPFKKTALIIHAGAGTLPKEMKRAKLIREKLIQITRQGHRYLKNHSARDTACEVVRLLENWPETNAGTGSVLQSDGKARLSASLMDGKAMRFSGVINLELIKNPVLVAKLLQAEKDRTLAGEGAFRFAKEKNFKTENPRTPKRLEEWEARFQTKVRGKYGTVGVCALDQNGFLAAATSTGGKGWERMGRVSDSATVAGNYANHFAAVSATGLGEDIIEEALAARIVWQAAAGKKLSKSVKEIFSEAMKRKRLFGAIGLDVKGNVFAEKTTQILYYAFESGTRSGAFSI